MLIGQYLIKPKKDFINPSTFQDEPQSMCPVVLLNMHHSKVISHMQQDKNGKGILLSQFIWIDFHLNWVGVNDL